MLTYIELLMEEFDDDYQMFEDRNDDVNNEQLDDSGTYLHEVATVLEESYYGDTALDLAAKYDRLIELFKRYLKVGVNIHTKISRGQTPLHYAAAGNHVDLVVFLLQNGANVNVKDYRGRMPLHLATETENIHLVEIILENGANVNVADCTGKMPLHLATWTKNIHLVEFLLEKGAEVNVLDNWNHLSPIQIAAMRNDIKIVQLLLNHGASQDKLDEAYSGRVTTTLHFAAHVGNLEMIELLMKNGFAKLDAKSVCGNTPLCMAVITHHLDVVKYLIENDSKILKNTRVHGALLDLCFSNQHVEILKYLIDSGMKYNKNSNANSLLRQSLLSGTLELWGYLLTCISKISAETYSIETEFHSAIRAGRVEIVRKLLNRHLSEEKSDSLASRLAIFIAVENGNEEILKILLEAGFSVESCFDDKLRPLHVAATFKHTRLAEMLLKAGAEINTKTAVDITPLDFAAATGCSNMVKFLLDNGAVPDKINNHHFTSLHFALNKEPDIGTKLNVTPSMFQNLIKITEMLLIAGDNKMKGNFYYNELLHLAIKLGISGENKQSPSTSDLRGASNEGNEEGEFHPEILRCLLNYVREDKLNDSLNFLMKNNKNLCTPDVLHVILEYYGSKSEVKLSHIFENHWNNLLVISQICCIDNLLNVSRRQARNKDEWNDLLKMITARLMLLPSDQQWEKRKFDFFRVNKLLIWQNECLEQVKSMQVVKIVDECDITFHDILTKSVDKVASYIRDEKLLNSLESSYDSFPAYAYFLKVCVQNGKQRNYLNDTCMNGMFQVIEKNYKIQFSFEALEAILQYLSVFDRQRLTGACSSLLSV